MKSIFTKLSTLLLCGVVAMVGCTDFSEDIQAVDKKAEDLKTELNAYKTTTAATIAELQSAIADLEATQAQMAADYAKKSELEAAKTELQDKLTAEIAKVNTAISDAVAAISALEAGKADKAEVAALQETVEAAIADANAAIAALEAAKADKTQVDAIAGDVATLIEGYQQMIYQFQNLSLIIDGKAEQADLEVVEKDVETLKNGYMETVMALQNMMGILDTKADQADLELAEKDIEALKVAAAEAVVAVTNLNASVEALDVRVESLESEMKKVQNEIALHTMGLQNLAGRLEAAEGSIEDETAARKAADKALQDAVALLEMGLTNLQVAYNIHLEELEAYKENVEDALEALELQDALIYKTIESIKMDLYNAIDATAETLRAEREEALAALEKKIVEAWEAERALIYKTIADIQNTLFAAIEEGDAALQEKMELADALIYKTIESYRGILEIAILEGDAAEAEAREAADALLYNTILDIQNTLFAAIEEGDAAVLETVTAQLEEELALVYKTVESIKMDLYNAIKYGDAEVAKAAQVALDEAVALVYKTIDSTKAELQAEIAQLNLDLVEIIDGHVADIYKTILSEKAELQAEIAELRNEFNALLGTVSMDVEALLARVQSLVYVPDYSDHKATIEWARVISNDVMTADLDDEKTPVYTNVAKKSDLKYLVKANAGEDAVTAAADIAAAWKDVLDYNVTDVKTRGASQTGADLEIVDVKADGEYIIVSVVAKNFDAKFFEHKRQGIYSAALVLGDKNGNNMTSEYTNLVPGKAAEVKAVILAGDKKTDITNTVVDETLYLQYDLEETVTPLDGHAVYFQEGDKTYSVEDFQKAGYDVKIDNKAITTLSADNTNTLVPAFINMSLTMLQGGFKYVPNPETKYWVVSLKETLDRESFGKINGTEEQDLEFKYIYTVNGVEIFAAQNVEISKKIVNVNLPVIEVPWTVAEAESLMAGGVTYSVDLVKEQTYDINEATGGKSLEGYTLASVMNRTAADKKVYINDEVVETADIKIQVKDRQETTYKMILGNRFDGNAKSYSFPVNNNDEKVDWNVYKATWTYELEDMKVFVTGTMQLGEQAPVQNVPVAVDFKVMKGVNGWLTGSADVLTAAYEQFKSYLGYADEATDKAKFLALFVGENNAIRYKETTVNEKAVDYMKNTPYTGFEPQNFKLHSSSLIPPVDYVYPVQVIQQVVKPWFGIDFNFIVNGNVVLPKDVLNYSTVDFVSYCESLDRWQVEVDGDIVADKSVQNGRKYTIDQADLGKYFYVSDEAEYGVDRMLTVKFDILTENAPRPLDTDVVEVFKDATSQINVLEAGKSVIKDWTDGGNFVGNEIKVKATLLANGFAINDKEVTLFTIDPLTFSKVPEVDVEGVDIQVERVPGKDAVVKSYRVLSLTSVAEEGNLINTDAKTGAGLFFKSHADEVYGAEFILHPEDEPTWTSQILGVYTKEGDEKVIYPGTKYDFTNGTLTLKADDGLLKQSIFAEVEYELTHNYNYGKNEKVTVVIEFVPNNEY